MLMSQITIDQDLCKRDGLCVAVCPARILVLNAEGFPEEIPDSHCILCGHCAAVCPLSAFQHAGLPEGEYLPMPAELPSPASMDGLLMSRRSVREFRDQPVGREVMEELLDVARRAPTATNSQKLHWIVIEDRAKLRALAQEVVTGGGPDRIRPAQRKQWEEGYDFVLRGAPTLAVVCAPKEYGWGKEDGAIALTYLELAAEARGLGACWAGYLTRIAAIHEPLCRLLAVPDGYVVCGGLMLGKGKFRYHRIPPRKQLSVQWA
jgi:nitroreductase/NAD-dependent dihydropyrimidine dehydrogenase PreA subunit